MTAKKIIKSFYKSDAFINVTEMDSFLHEEFLLEWQSSKGLVKMNKQEALDFTREMSVSYLRTKVKIHSLVKDKNHVAIRFSHFVKTVENPREDILLAHFFAIFELKEDKLFNCYQMSQLN